MNLGNYGRNSLFDAALEGHRVCTGGNRADAFLKDRLGENGRGRGTVTGDVRGLAGDLADHLRTHVLERVLKLDLFSHRDTVLGDGRRAEFLVDDDVAAFRAQGDLDRVGELVNTAQDSRA